MKSNSLSRRFVANSILCSARVFQVAQHALQRLGRQPASFVESEDALHDAARKTVGFDDFGDPAYLEGLRVLLEAYDREAKFTPFGRMMARAQLAGLLRNRLVAQKAWAEKPEILKSEIRRPIFILGLPRTGTTALHHLLGQDPGIQTLEYWLAAAPQPRPARDQWESHPNFKESVRELKTMYYLDPSLKAMHLMTAEGPEECRHLMAQNCTDDSFFDNASIPTYSEWFKEKYLSDTYVRHRDLLKLIGSRQPERRWVLKYPVHMRNLRALLEIYPDACIIQTHRDPIKVLPSLCSLVAGWRSLYEVDIDPKAIAEEQIGHWAPGMIEAMELRKGLDSSAFFDLHFREVLADPLGAAKRVYAHFDLELTPEAEKRMQAWIDDNPRGKYGEHRYTLEQFGLTDRAITEPYAPYIDYFQIERESSG